MNCLRKHMCWQSKRFYWEGMPGGKQKGKGTQEDCSATWLTVSCFMVKGLVSGLSLTNHSDSGSFLVAHALLKQDGCQREGFWEMVGHVVSPFDLSWTLPVGGGLFIPCSLSGPPVIKQLTQMVTMMPGHGGGLQTVLPLTIVCILYKIWKRLLMRLLPLQPEK